MTINKQNARRQILKLTQTALFAGICFIAFRFFKIDIPIMGDKTAIHLANAFVVLAALMIGPIHGGLAGAIGLSLADLLSDYASSAPKTFVLKFCIGLIAGLVAHHIGRINERQEHGKIVKWTVLAAAAGLGFNVIFDPLLGYFYIRYLFGQPVTTASIIAKWSAGITFLNAAVSLIVVTVIYLAMRRALGRKLTEQVSSRSKT